MLVAEQAARPGLQTGIAAQARLVFVPQGAQSCGLDVSGFGTNPPLHGGSGVLHTGCAGIPAMPPQRMHAVPAMSGMKPGAQSVTRQAPVAQVNALPLAMRVALQAIPQPPQWALVLSVCSHPFMMLPSQLPRPAAQAMRQTPPTQLPVPPVLLHALPHAPQCSTLVAVATQPAPTEVQSVVPVGHDVTQVPAEHRWPAGQTVPHVPQLALSLCRLVQVPPQTD